jgi:hypothetical protein
MGRNFIEFVGILIDIINPLLILLVGLSLLAFFWGLARFIIRVGGDAKAVEEGKSLMKWGLVALFVMVSFLGIINFFYRDLGFNTGQHSLLGIPFLPTN